ncbi:hypothetical protein CJ030_MR7G016796 [Morella rubra]|uniref:Uncharacterized protein n=1 Tax=Morella rubra TaxID=262757 RepID=A0A6A1UXQ0_9ROSI|nr:hypothetical protein CJ030_MR7G016796 [Morella rubra]
MLHKAQSRLNLCKSTVIIITPHLMNRKTNLTRWLGLAQFSFSAGEMQVLFFPFFLTTFSLHCCSLSPLFAGIPPQSREKILAKASDVETLLAVGEGAVKKKGRPHRGEDFKFREALIKADFWLLWFSFFLAVGSGITVLNNLAFFSSATACPPDS